MRTLLTRWIERHILTKVLVTIGLIICTGLTVAGLLVPDVATNTYHLLREGTAFATAMVWVWGP